MAMLQESVELPSSLLEASPPRSAELTGHNGETFGKGINKNLANGAQAYSTNGFEADYANGVTKPNVDQPIAVIGMALRFPQDATSSEKFWEMLVDGRSARTEVPKERYNVDSHYRSDTCLPETVSICRRRAQQVLIY